MILRRGLAAVDVRPGEGGRIGQITVAGQSLMRGQDDGASSWHDWGCYPLVPWSNRIAGARFTFRGVEHRMQANFPDGSAIHGLASEARWQVTRSDAHSATLGLLVDRAPFVLDCREEIGLREDCLDVALSVVNRGALPVPAGLGIHPWLRAGAVRVPAERVYPCERCIPVGQAQPVGPAEDLRTKRIPPRLDDCFTGLTDASAEVGGVRITWSDEITHVVVYTGVLGWVCCEPVTHANDGFNLLDRGWPGTGVRVLEPGEAFSASFAFEWDSR